jgi:hypothetical protein
MVEIKTHRDHPRSMKERISNRLKPSAGAGAGDEQVTTGNSPNRVVTTVHHSGGAKRQGEPNKGEGDIDGNRRDFVRTGDGR